MNNKVYKEGSTVFGKWGQSNLKGIVAEVYLSPIEKQLKGSKVKRKASPENSAYLIRKDNKNTYVLKLHSELLNDIE